MSKKKKSVDKEFKFFLWVIDNKIIIYVFIVIILFLGVGVYLSMLREIFLEIKEIKIYISILYFGNIVEDIE